MICLPSLITITLLEEVPVYREKRLFLTYSLKNSRRKLVTTRLADVVVLAIFTYLKYRQGSPSLAVQLSQVNLSARLIMMAVMVHASALLASALQAILVLTLL